MRVRHLRLVCLLLGLAVAIPYFAQAQRGGAAADPISGVWTGDWGPNANDRNRVEVDLKLNGKAVTGTVKSVQPARADVMIQKSTFDGGALHMEAEVKSPRGGELVHYIID